MADTARIIVATVMAGLRLDFKGVDDVIFHIGFRRCDPGHIDLEQKTLLARENPFGTRLSPMSQVQTVTYVSGSDNQRLGAG